MPAPATSLGLGLGLPHYGGRGGSGVIGDDELLDENNIVLTDENDQALTE